MGEGHTFLQFIAERFGIDMGDYAVDERKSKVYIYARGLEALESGLIQRKGILAGKLDTLYGIKPSLDFVLVFGRKATENFIRLDYTSIQKLYSGERIPIADGNCGDGLIIVQDMQGNGAALVFTERGFLKPLIPKERLI